MTSLAICCIDTRDHHSAAEAVLRTVAVMQQCHPVCKVYWFSDQVFPYPNTVPVQWVKIPTITIFPQDYNHVALSVLPQCVREDFCMVVQSDGHAVNASAWTPEFFKYDYIGAVWQPGYVDPLYTVGNGGFSWRSQKLLAALNRIQHHHQGHEDTEICHALRPQLEQQYDIKFAPEEVAHQFSIEYCLNNAWLGKSLGFHSAAAGKFYNLLPSFINTECRPASAPTMSLCVIDTKNHTQAASAVIRTIACINSIQPISCVHWFSDQPFEYDIPTPVHWHVIDPITNFPLDYNKVALKLVPNVVLEDFCLIVQADGHAVNSHAWMDQFLNFDYIGSPFNLHWLNDRSLAVGNGGFSLRSQKLHAAIADLDITASQRGEDVVISWDYRKILESKYGIKFAPLEIAHQFSVDLNLNLKYGPCENLPWLGSSFGFHGLHCAKQYYGSEVGDVLPVIKKKESKMKIAVYTVALNEQKFAARWANSVSEADYLIVADTGSTDGTQQALRLLGAQVFDVSVRPWRFDMARNIALSLVPSDADVCISMDMDELMAPGWRQEIEKHWMPNATKLRYTYVHNFDHNDQPLHSFMADKIHSRFGYQWRRPVHETIFALGDELVVTASTVVMWHKQDGAKSRGQYLPLLEQSHQEFPECSQTAYWLAREYAFAGQNDTAIDHFKKYLSMPGAAWSDERAEAATWLSNLCAHEKLKWLLAAVGESPQRREGWLNLAEYYYKQADWANLYASALEGTKITHRSNSYLDYQHAWGGRIWDLAGLGAWNLGLKTQSLTLFEQAHKLEPLDARIQNNYRLVKEHMAAIQEHT